jgi:peptidyl-prolyl cis-trans isomerase SurA
VRQYSTDEGNKASGGRVGWITVFSVPYVSESTIYALPVNGFSPVVKTSAGFHIFSNLAERPAAGTVKVAQIMLVNPDPGNRSIDEKNQRLADSLYDALQKGSRFDSLAYLFSNDRTSYSEGGVLQEFGVGTYSGKFEDVAFSLKKNEVSKPFKTEYGIHILKLLDAKPIPASMEDADFSAGLLEKVNATGRSQAAKNVFLKSQLQAFKFKPAPIAEKELFRFTDSSIGSGNIAGLPVTTKTPVFLMGTQTITANDWLNYIKTAKFLQSNENKSYTELLQAFYLAKTEEYIFRNIEKIDPPVKSQLKEFSDANLLFESMEMNVWNKAATDTAGLQAWYNNHKANYKWSESALAALVTCTDTSTLSAVLPALQNNPNAWHELADSYASSMFADSSRFELSQLPLGNETVKEGLVTAPVKNEQDGSYSFAVVFKKMPANEQRSFEDARGFVINDYQLLLEENWVKALRKKYPVTINQPVFAKLVKAPTK